MNQVVSDALERAWTNLGRVWRRISQASRASLPTPAADLPDADVGGLRQRIEECIAARGGEVSSRARAAGVGEVYLTLSPKGRRRFLLLLASEFGVDHKRLVGMLAEVRSAQTADEQMAVRHRLREVLTPRHLKLLTQFNSLPSGVKFLVDMRADLLGHIRSEPRLRGLELDLKALLTSWFDVGFLDLERITWDSPAALLERLIAYEAVHEIESWEDMKNRLAEDRRCFAFFHPRMPEEPLIFVEVALVTGMSDRIQTLLEESAERTDPQQANTAIFYSISNTQKGLQGISLGSFLIKRVLDRLTAELPGLRTFATLSPIPDFGRYLRTRPLSELPLSDEDRQRIAALSQGPVSESLRNLLETPGWHRQKNVERTLEAPLKRLCADFLLTGTRTKGRAPDRVAHFHLSNGARIERVNWLGDTSDRGLGQSAGLMVNYRYEPTQIEANHETYRTRGRAVASPEVLALLDGQDEGKTRNG